MLFRSEPQRPVCARCGHVVYLDPKIAVGTIIQVASGGLVLVRRAIEPGYGKWVFPGGYVDRGEPLTAAAVREAREECGLDVVLDGLVNVLLLSREQMRQVLAQAPKGFGAQPAKYHSDGIFLMGVPAAEAFKAFNPRDGVDRVWQGDLAIYSERLSAQRTKSRLSKVMSDPVYKRMTIRSWQTTEKLAALLESLAS